MAKITFITRQGETIIAEGSSGSVMELAVENDVEGIYGDCGGICSCATCHIHLTPEDFEKLKKPDDFEMDLLEFEDTNSPYSRLSCQIELSDLIDGMVFKVANE